MQVPRQELVQVVDCSLSTTYNNIPSLFDLDPNLASVLQQRLLFTSHSNVPRL